MSEKTPVCDGGAYQPHRAWEKKVKKNAIKLLR